MVEGSTSLDLLGVSCNKRLKLTPYIKSQAFATRRIQGAITALARYLPSSYVTTIARTLVLGKTGCSVAAHRITG